jgi:hypothetical protein
VQLCLPSHVLKVVPVVMSFILVFPVRSTCQQPAPAGFLSAAANAAAARPAGAKPSSAAAAVRPVTTNVRVRSTPAATDLTEGYERKITAGEVEQSAGTFGDPARFMQLLPGVVSDNDQRNDFIIRGGNPAETLFVVDNIEMPSINQLALSDTTGGFVSMIDNDAVHHLTLHTDAYDAKFDQRLSAVVEISTRPEGTVGFHAGTQFGIGGTGFFMQRPLGSDRGSMFVSVRRSVLNLFTNDIGMNGVPIYSNALLRMDRRLDERNTVWGLSLTGVDSMDIHPDPGDTWETLPFDIHYTGWRNTTGMNWQHLFSARTFGTVSVSNSEQEQVIRDDSQLLPGVEAYFEDSHDGKTTLKYDWMTQPRHWMTITAGAQADANRLFYSIHQPVQFPNPYSADPALGGTMSIDRKFTAFSSAGYVQAGFTMPHRLRLVLGERTTQWALLGTSATMPKGVLFAPVPGTRMMFHVGYAEYAQLPPTLYVLSFDNHGRMTPMHSRHLTAGLSLIDTPQVRVTLNAYQKHYHDYPVSTMFPQLTMANIADTFGEAFLMFPMTSQGRGITRGVESAIDWRPTHRLTLASTATYMRSWFSGLDGVLRKGAFDMPLVANLSGNTSLGRGWTASFRYSMSTGKPYTPDNLELSTAQDRDVYDLSRLNSLRAPTYSRLDFRWEWTRPLRGGMFNLHFGLENALGTTNFYSLLWRPRCVNDPSCGVLQQNQMPRFPDFGIKFSR